MRLKKPIGAIFFIFIVFCACYIVLRMPVQDLKITAVTKAERFNIQGATDLYYWKPLDAGETYTAVIKFMAIESKSNDLFTSYGKGQSVYLGCNELTAKCQFISFGRFLRVKLTLNAAETDLKLEDGTPFDSTRYSLKPVLAIEN